MSDAVANGRQPEPEPTRPSTPYNLADVVPDLPASVSDVLGRNVGSAVASLPSSPELLIHLALAKKLEDIHTTILSVKAKADHAQQVASSALDMASVTASAPRTHARVAAAPPKPKPPCYSSPQTYTPPPPLPLSPLPLLPLLSPAPEARSPFQLLPPCLPPRDAGTPSTSLLSGPTQTFRPPGFPPKDHQRPYPPPNSPALLANLLLEKKIPRVVAVFIASINDDRTVSITAPQGYAAGFYAPYYDQLAKVTQQHISPENNSYEALRPAPAPASDSILRPPLRPRPPLKSHAVHLATRIAVGNARNLLPWERITKQTTSLVIQVPPTDAPSLIKKGNLLFNRVRLVRVMWSATPAAQCTLC